MKNVKRKVQTVSRTCTAGHISHRRKKTGMYHFTSSKMPTTSRSHHHASQATGDNVAHDPDQGPDGEADELQDCPVVQEDDGEDGDDDGGDRSLAATGAGRQLECELVAERRRHNLA